MRIGSNDPNRAFPRRSCLSPRISAYFSSVRIEIKFADAMSSVLTLRLPATIRCSNSDDAPNPIVVAYRLQLVFQYAEDVLTKPNPQKQADTGQSIAPVD